MDIKFSVWWSLCLLNFRLWIRSPEAWWTFRIKPNWNSFAPHSWKWGTLKTLTLHAYMICSTTELLDTELKYLQVFVEKNNYPKWVIKQIFAQVKFIISSNSSPPIETIELPANENETVTKKAYVTFTLPRRHRHWFNHIVKKKFR